MDGMDRCPKCGRLVDYYGLRNGHDCRPYHNPVPPSRPADPKADAMREARPEFARAFHDATDH